MWPQSMLMVHPEHFDVEYAINPHMLNEQGDLNKIDRNKAKEQWTKLKDTFQSLGMKVDVLPAVEKLPDMVFCANQTFPFKKGEEKHLVLSQMASEKRQPEVEYFKKWALEMHWTVHELNSPLFEGMGDLLWNYESGELYGGYGFRTEKKTYQEIEKIVGQKITSLELTSNKFYHLDTCLSILNKDTAAYVPSAFSDESLQVIQQSFSQLIEVPEDEAEKYLACNCCTPNGKDIIIQEGAQQTTKALKEAGFRVIEIDTSEYIKSGGSVFCMKQLLF